MPLPAQLGCYNHADREAVARCPECGQIYCRECITEHDGRVICAACLIKLARPVVSRRRVWAGLVHAFAAACGLVLAWLFFYHFGTALLALPSAFHEGTLWRLD